MRADWEAIENEYQVGQLTVRQIAAKHKVATSSITRRAKKCGWSRDLSEQVRVATRAALVAQHADERTQNAHTVVEVAAEVNRKIIEAGRTSLQQARDRHVRLAKRMDDALDLTEQYAPLELLKAAQDAGLDTAQTKALMQLANLGELMQMNDKLASAVAKIEALVRVAYNLDSDAAKPKSWETHWLKVAQEAAAADKEQE